MNLTEDRVATGTRIATRGRVVTGDGAIERGKRVALLIVLIIGLAVRWPMVSAGVPFFYEEDEAHHFNRVVEMVKKGSYNPEYFHKPSFHFYLRMPVVAFAFLWNVREGHIRSVKEIVTRDPYGVGNYAFSVSHPGILKWNRLWNVCISLLLVAGAFSLAARWTGNIGAAMLAGLLTALSPDLVRDSAKIGVDTPMAALALLSVAAAVLFVEKRERCWEYVCPLLAGLAISTKYNALPVAVVPVLALLCARVTSLFRLGRALALVAAGFLVGSPFVLAQLPLFLDQFAYEIWHYGIAGHEGHTGEPGLPQLFFYLSWIGGSALGWCALVSALAGFFIMLRMKKGSTAVFAAFPILFAALMVSQRANFTRNMLPILPFLAVSAAVAAQWVVQKFRVPHLSALWPVLGMAALVAGQPAATTLHDLHKQALLPESRLEAMRIIRAESGAGKEIAVAGQLQLPYEIVALPGVTRIDETKTDLTALADDGYDLFFATAQFAAARSAEVVIRGEPAGQRIVRNPEVRMFRLDTAARAAAAPVSEVRITAAGVSACAEAEGSGSAMHCWLTKRRTQIILDPDESATVPLLEVMSPWAGQTITVSAGEIRAETVIAADQAGQWVPLTAPDLLMPAALVVEISTIRSPAERGMGSDSRRLGAAVRVRQ